MKLISDATGQELGPRDMVWTFRGEPVQIIDLVPPRKLGSSGHVVVRYDNGDEGMYYPGVIGARFEP